MTRALPRSALLWATTILAWIVWLLAFSWPGAGTPWSPRTRTPVSLQQMQGALARVVADGDGIRIEGIEAGRSVDVTAEVDPFEASDFRSLRYSATGVPASRKLVLTWDSDAGRGFVTLPPSLGASGMLDLGRIPGWKGRVGRIGFALVPVDYVPAPALGAPDVGLSGVVLSSASWRDAISLLWHEWSAARAWTGRSNNTAGFDFGGTRAPSLPGFIAGGVAITLLLMLALAGRQHAARIAVPLIFGACVLLSLEQLRQHAARTTTSVAASRAVAALDGGVLSAHPPLQGEASALLQRMRQDGPRARIWVHGATGFFGDYPVWLLREQDAGGLLGPNQLPDQSALAGAFLVLVGQGDWGFDPATSQVRIGAETRAAELYFTGARMQAYRFLPAKGAGP
jgi:hypothetical protein